MNDAMPSGLIEHLLNLIAEANFQQAADFIDENYRDIISSEAQKSLTEMNPGRSHNHELARSIVKVLALNPGVNLPRRISVAVKAIENRDYVTSGMIATATDDEHELFLIAATIKFDLHFGEEERRRRFESANINWGTALSDSSSPEAKIEASTKAMNDDVLFLSKGSILQLLWRRGCAKVVSSENCTGSESRNYLNNAISDFTAALAIMDKDAEEELGRLHFWRADAYLRLSMRLHADDIDDNLSLAIDDFCTAIQLLTNVHQTENVANALAHRAVAYRHQAERRTGKNALDGADRSIADSSAALKMTTPGTDITLRGLIRDERAASYIFRASLRGGSLARLDCRRAIIDLNVLVNSHSQRSFTRSCSVDLKNRGFARYVLAKHCGRRAARANVRRAIEDYSTALSSLPNEGMAFWHIEIRAARSRSYALHAQIGRGKSSAADYVHACEDLKVALKYAYADDLSEIIIKLHLQLAQLHCDFNKTQDAISCFEAAIERGAKAIRAIDDQIARSRLANLLSNAGDEVAGLYISVDDIAGAIRAVSLGRSIKSEHRSSTGKNPSEPSVYESAIKKRQQLRSARRDLLDAIIRREEFSKNEHAKIDKNKYPNNEIFLENIQDWYEYNRNYRESANRLDESVKLKSINVETSKKSLDATLDEVEADQRLPDIVEIGASIPEGGALAIVIATKSKGHLILIPAGADSLAELRVKTLSKLSRGNIAALLAGRHFGREDDPADVAYDGIGWLDSYDAARQDAARSPIQSDGTLSPAFIDFADECEDLLTVLWDLVGGHIDGELRSLGLPAEAERQLVLMLPGQLASLPTHAARRLVVRHDGSVGWRALLEDWVPSFSESPAALVATNARLRAVATRKIERLLAITGPSGCPAHVWQNPALDVFSQCETTELAGPLATPRNVINHLVGHSIISFFCHGIWNPIDPSRSYLLLSGDEVISGCLSMPMLEMADADLEDCRLAVLSACELGQSFGLLPDEFEGFGPRLSAHVPAVISTLFFVEANISAAFVRAVLGAIRAAQKAGCELPPAVAVNRAQRALAYGGLAELERLVPPSVREQACKLEVPGVAGWEGLGVSGASTQSLQATMLRWVEPDEVDGDVSDRNDRHWLYKFSKRPMFWAAYVIYGL